MAFKTIIAFVKKDWDLVNQCYDKYIDVEKTDSAMFSMTYYRYATLGKLAADGKYAEAAEMANEMTNIDKYKFLMLVYEAAGDTAKAYLAQKDYITVKDSITQNIRMEELQGAAHDLEVASHISETRKTKAINIILCIVFIGAGCIISVLVFHSRKRKQYTKELEQKNKELTEARIEAEKAEDLKLSIMKNMSHEIRSPLNVISGFAQVIGNSEFQMTESLRAELAGMVQKSTDSITNILNELLDISDNGAKYGKVKYNQENLLAICHEAAEKCRKKVVPGIEVNVTSALPDDFMFTTNREELLKAMECILDNARKFTETGSITIESRMADNGKQLEISITDTGCGIEEGEEDLIFDHFYKSDKHKEGIGLGLTLARRIIYHLNGNLTLDTSYKNGARFLITLPMEG
jgi:signal transduction histidine kinase